jgi:hypothetical protein
VAAKFWRKALLRHAKTNCCAWTWLDLAQRTKGVLPSASVTSVLSSQVGEAQIAQMAQMPREVNAQESQGEFATSNILASCEKH